MSSTNKTTYYELPQFVDDDIFNPLVDDNDAYNKIDTALHQIAEAEADDASEIVGVKGRVTTVEGKVDALETQNGSEVLTTTAQTLSGAVNELDGDVSSLDGRLDIVEDDINNENTGLKAKVSALETQNGNEVLTTTAQTLSGAVNELVNVDEALDNKFTYVTPQMYGAVADGVTDDSDAFIAMFADTSKNVTNSIRIPSGVYYINKEVLINRKVTMIGVGNPFIKLGPNGYFFLARSTTGVDFLGVEQSAVRSYFKGITFGNTNYETITLDGSDETLWIGNIFKGLLMYMNFDNCEFFKTGTVFECLVDPIQDNAWWGALYFTNCSFNRCSEIFHLEDDVTYPLNQVAFTGCHIVNSRVFNNEKSLNTGNSVTRVLSMEEITFSQCDIERVEFFNNIEQTGTATWVTSQWNYNIHVRNVVIEDSYIEHTLFIDSAVGANSCSAIMLKSNWFTTSGKFIEFNTPTHSSESDYCTIIMDDNNVNLIDASYAPFVVTTDELYHVLIKSSRGLNRLKNGTWSAMSTDEIAACFNCVTLILLIDGNQLVNYNGSGYTCYPMPVVEITSNDALLKTYDFLNVLPTYCHIYQRNTLKYYFKTGYGQSIQVFDKTGDLFSLFIPRVRNVGTGTTIFKNQTKLQYVKFTGEPISGIASDLFNGCTALTDIYVPWDSSAAINANAPWGATNATMHYNS